MKTTTSLIMISLIVFACHRRIVASSDNVIISNKTRTASDKGLASSQAISSGQNIYNTRCGRCHYLKTVQDYTAQQWDNILRAMVPKARLNQDEAKQVKDYVMEHAKK